MAQVPAELAVLSGSIDAGESCERISVAAFEAERRVVTASEIAKLHSSPAWLKHQNSKQVPSSLIVLYWLKVLVHSTGEA